jgi:predicted aminopeptidase
MKQFKRFLVLSFVFMTLTGCGNVLYLSKLGWHQSYVTFHSIPIQEVLDDRGTDEGTKEKIRFIQEVKHYGEEHLGLKGTKSYSRFFEVKGPILHVVTACEKDRLQLYHWDFPIVGSVTYKGFFTQEDAVEEKNLLDRKGYDTFVQRAAAYSTLGWLKDPIFSSMLEWNEAALANLILHEMSHATVYMKGETDFNEQIATFIGNRGAIDFLIGKYGPESEEVVEAVHSQEDDLLFSEWIDQACQQLASYYAKEISRDEKLKGREEIFQSIRETLKEMKGRLKTDCYRELDKIELNNAVLLAYRRYFHRLDSLEMLYDYFGRDLRRVIEFLKEVRGSREAPSTYLERWMKERGLSIPSGTKE